MLEITIGLILIKVLFFSMGVEFVPRLIISDKGPVENSDRDSEHSLHGAFGHALSSG